MNLKQIQDFQDEFDKAHGWDWKNYKNAEELIRLLQHAAIALTGEVGEFANVLKKINREFTAFKKEPSEEMFNKLREEITDCFIYAVIIANILDMDLEQEYFKKMKFNEGRFEKYKNRKK